MSKPSSQKPQEAASDKRASARFYGRLFRVCLNIALLYYVFFYSVAIRQFGKETAKLILTVLTLALLVTLYKWLARTRLKSKTDRIVGGILIAAFVVLTIIDILR